MKGLHQNKQVIAVHISTQQITTQNQRAMGHYESNGSYSQPAYSVNSLYKNANSEQDCGGEKQKLHCRVVIARPSVQNSDLINIARDYVWTCQVTEHKSINKLS